MDTAIEEEDLVNLEEMSTGPLIDEEAIQENQLKSSAKHTLVKLTSSQNLLAKICSKKVQEQDYGAHIRK